MWIDLWLIVVALGGCIILNSLRDLCIIIWQLWHRREFEMIERLRKLLAVISCDLSAERADDDVRCGHPHLNREGPCGGKTCFLIERIWPKASDDGVPVPHPILRICARCGRLGVAQSQHPSQLLEGVCRDLRHVQELGKVLQLLAQTPPDARPALLQQGLTRVLKTAEARKNPAHAAFNNVL